MQKFKIVGKPLLREKYVEAKRKNNAKFSGHYVRPRTHNVRAHELRSHQKERHRQTALMFPLEKKGMAYFILLVASYYYIL